ncbi:MAG TPA: hypothetical protein VD770_03565 [Coxiellaceae bacterium]|nr:hypothetical protein [Coxiellaceae bacterium]
MGKIHFIWAGGEKPIPALSRVRIRAWKALNPGSEVWIWIYPENSPSIVKETLERRCPAEPRMVADVVRLASLQELLERNDNSTDEKNTINEAINEFKAEAETYGFAGEGFVTKDIRELRGSIEDFSVIDADSASEMRMLYDMAIYQCMRLRPNFGASSDLLRYLILFFHSGPGANWGAYFDHDVMPGLESIDSAFAHTNADLLFAANSQRRGFIGNDSFVCRALHHDFFKKVLQKVYVNFDHPDWGLRPLLYDADAEALRKNDTVLRTGPIVIARTLYEEFIKRPSSLSSSWTEDNFMVNQGSCTAVIPPSNSAIPLEVCPGSSNAYSWGEARVRPIAQREDALFIASESIKYEAQYLGILRLDDHVADVVASLSAEAPVANAGAGVATGAHAVTSIRESNLLSTDAETAVAEDLIARLEREGLDLTQVRARPLISRYANVRAFYHSHLPTVYDYPDSPVRAAYVFDNLLTVATEPENILRPAVRTEMQAIADCWIPCVEPSVRRCLVELNHGHLSEFEMTDRIGLLQGYLQDILKVKKEATIVGVELPVEELVLRGLITQLEEFSREMREHRVHWLDAAGTTPSVGAVASGGVIVVSTDNAAGTDDAENEEGEGGAPTAPHV